MIKLGDPTFSEKSGTSRRKSVPLKQKKLRKFRLGRGQKHARQAGRNSGDWYSGIVRGLVAGRIDLIMGTSTQTLYDRTSDAIGGLLTALTDHTVQEYQMPDGRRVRRAEFATTLQSLQALRAALAQELAGANRSRVALGRFNRR